jgi:hypothetical protein
MTATEKQLKYLLSLFVKSKVPNWAGAQQYMADRGVLVDRFEDLTTQQASRLIQSLTPADPRNMTR